MDIFVKVGHLIDLGNFAKAEILCNELFSQLKQEFKDKTLGAAHRASNIADLAVFRA